LGLIVGGIVVWLGVMRMSDGVEQAGQLSDFR
jgi:hypothetical protein